MHACFGLIVVFLLWWRMPLFFGVHVSKLLLIITESHIGIAGSYYIGDEDLERTLTMFTMAVTHGTLGPFDLSSGDWKSYVERVKLYFTANDITAAGKQRAILLNSCGEATYRRIKDVLSPRSLTDVNCSDICTMMSAHLQPVPSEIVQRFHFNTRVRQPQESISTYVTQLKWLAEHCNFGDTARLNEMI